MKRVGMKPDASCYAYLMQAYRHADKFKEVELLFEEMELNRIHPIESIFGIRIACFAKQKDLSSALRVAQCMKNYHLQPNEHIATLLLSGVKETLNLEILNAILDFIKKEKIKFNQIIYNSLIHCYSILKDSSKVEELLQEMKEAGFERDQFSWSSAISCFSSSPSLVVSAYEEMMKEKEEEGNGETHLTSSMCDTVVSSYLSLGDHRNAFEV